jgi:hypothetical protein
VQPKISGEGIIESLEEAQTSHHVLAIYRNEPEMGGEVLDGFVESEAGSFLVRPEVMAELGNGLWDCYRQHRTNRVTRLLQRIPFFSQQITDHRRTAGRMLNDLNTREKI